MARLDCVVRIDARPEVVWGVLADVEKWPEWTPTILSVVRQGEGAFGMGSTAKVHARGFAEDVLTVTEFTPGRSFTWTGRGGPGMTVELAHVIEADGTGSRVTLSVVPAGPAAVLLGWLAVRMSRKNVETEAEMLKKRVEELARAT